MNIDEFFTCGAGRTANNWWNAQDPTVLNAAVAALKSHGANPWVFSADERHFEQFADTDDRRALLALTDAQHWALCGHWFSEGVDE